jgi:hypothetical protein
LLVLVVVLPVPLILAASGDSGQPRTRGCIGTEPISSAASCPEPAPTAASAVTSCAFAVLAAFAACVKMSDPRREGADRRLRLLTSLRRGDDGTAPAGERDDSDLVGDAGVVGRSSARPWPG